MNLSFKPMLACSTIPALEDIEYPVLASPKLDGIRCIMADGIAFSRNMKRIPNKHIQEVARELQLHGLDGELMINGDFNSVQSAIMSEHGKPDFYYNVFDCWLNEKSSFSSRLTDAYSIVKAVHDPRIRFVEQRFADTPKQLLELWEGYASEGYEGAIIRDPLGPYKQGRSTPKQGWMSKLKTFYDDEAVVIDTIELMHNGDTSTKQLANLVPGNKLGAFVVRWRDKEFKIGSGFDDDQRRQYWKDRKLLKGLIVTFKYQELSKYGVPRFPVFKGFRSTDDV